MKKIFLTLISLISLSLFAVPTVGFMSSTQYISTQDGKAMFVVKLSEVTTDVVTIPFAVTGTATASNHNLVDGELVIGPNEKVGIISFDLFDDGSAVDQTIEVKLLAPMNAHLGKIKKQTITLTNASLDLPKVYFASIAQTGKEGATLKIRAKLDRPTTQVVLIPYSLSGTATGDDHNLRDGLFVFAPGKTAVTLEVTLTKDAVVEGAETLVLTMHPPVSNAILDVERATDTITIED